MNSIEFKKVRMHGGITDGIVDPRNLCAALQQWLKRQFPDAAQTVESIDCHALFPCGFGFLVFCFNNITAP